MSFIERLWYDAVVRLAGLKLPEGGLYLGADGSETAVTATAAELNRVADVSGRLVTSAAATLALDVDTHDGKTVVLTKTDGQAVTLPAATGSGARFRVVIGATIASVGTTIKVVGNDTMKGLALGLDGDGVPANAWATASDSDTITMDGSTQGGVVGDVVELQDIAADIWAVQLRLQQSGTEATPFSATV
jgi:hypothetical protein